MSNKGRKLPPEVLTEEEVQRLMRACSHRAPTGIRNRALIAILYRAGLRIGEALSLRIKDLDLAEGTIRVLNGKGQKARTVGADAGCFALVERWLGERKSLGISGRAPVFCTLRGARLSRAYCRALFKRLGRKAGIEKRVHPHGLRHTHAFELASEGVPPHVIQKQLGHSSAATTSRYIDHLRPADVIEAMRSREWAPRI